jgi:hypothetical protein
LLSRILVELDFRKAVPDGIEHGRKIGDYTVNHLFATGSLTAHPCRGANRCASAWDSPLELTVKCLVNRDAYVHGLFFPTTTPSRRSLDGDFLGHPREIFAWIVGGFSKRLSLK